MGSTEWYSDQPITDPDGHQYRARFYMGQTPGGVTLPVVQVLTTRDRPGSAGGVLFEVDPHSPANAAGLRVMSQLLAQAADEIDHYHRDDED
jgi:hypothetical protein